MRRASHGKKLLLAAVVMGPLAAIMNALSGPQAPPDFAAMCAQNKPFYVASMFRGQSSSNKPPDPGAPSVAVFQDTANDTSHYQLANYVQTGAVWGLAYSRTEGAIYAGTYHKRGLPYGPRGAGAIYRIDLASGDVKPFITVPNAGINKGGSNSSDGSFTYDASAAKKVGKTALGDIDLNADDSELFVVNLDDRHIYRYALPDGAPLGNFYHGAVNESWARDARPFGLAWFGGHLYHGVVNARGTGADFVAKVYRSNADGSEMTEVASLPLRYERDRIKGLDSLRGGTVMWGPWSDNLADDPTRGPVDRMHVPQPMLTDIAFTPDGQMTLALRDRHWDMVTQWVAETRVTVTVEHVPGPPPADPVVSVMTEGGLGFGDLLYGVPDGDHYTINTDPEHFDDSNAMGHDESAMGGLACLADSNSLGATAFGIEKASGKFVLGEEGVYWYDVPSGNKTGHESLQRPGSFLPYSRLLTGAKAWAHGPFVDIYFPYEWYRDSGSLGDLEALCGSCSPGVVVPTPTVATDTPEPPTPTPLVPPSDTATPTDTSTATATATATDTPTPTATPGPVYLPIQLKEQCDPVQVRANVVLALDASASMAGAQLQAAKDAANAFIDAMKLPADQVGIVAFNATAWVASPITGDRAALAAAVAGITVSPGTRIDAGLEVATQLLDAAGSHPDVTPMVVVLTDGIQSGDLARPVALAAALRQRGVVVHVVGLGHDINAGYLQQVAGDPTHVHIAPGTAELTQIYLDIARVIPCPPSAYWGKR